MTLRSQEPTLPPESAPAGGRFNLCSISGPEGDAIPPIRNVLYLFACRYIVGGTALSGALQRASHGMMAATEIRYGSLATRQDRE
jgi:hypothetical protein